MATDTVGAYPLPENIDDMPEHKQLLGWFCHCFNRPPDYITKTGEKKRVPELPRWVAEIKRLREHIATGLYTREQVIEAFKRLAEKNLSNPSPWLVITFGTLREIQDEPSSTSEHSNGDISIRFDPESRAPTVDYPQTGCVAKDSPIERLYTRLYNLAYAAGFYYSAIPTASGQTC